MEEKRVLKSSHRRPTGLFFLLFVFVVATIFLIRQNRLLTSRLQQKISTPAEITVSPTTPISHFPKWETYRNDEFGFEMRYPPYWDLKVKSKGDVEKAEALQLEWDIRDPLVFSLEADPRPLNLVLSHLDYDYQEFIGEKRFYLVQIDKNQKTESEYSHWLYYTGELERPTLVFEIGFPTDEEASYYWPERLNETLASLKFLPLVSTEWRTYTNSEDGYSLEYPVDKFVRSICPGEELLLETRGENKTQELIQKARCGRDVRYGLEIISHSDRPVAPKTDDVYVVTNETIRIGGLEAEKYEATAVTEPRFFGHDYWYITIFIKRQDKTYEIYFKHKELEDTFDEILQTFKILG